jgi:hypothetical protein
MKGNHSTNKDQKTTTTQQSWNKDARNYNKLLKKHDGSTMLLYNHLQLE